MRRRQPPDATSSSTVTPFKHLKRHAEPWGVRPEDRDESAAQHYSTREAERYTAAGESSGIQADMTTRAWQLLALSEVGMCARRSEWDCVLTK